MSDRPNLSLPPREEWTGVRPRRSGLGAVLLGAGLAAVLGIQLYGLFRPAAAPAAATAKAPAIPPATLREVAVRLQRDNLHAAAAEAYEEYLAAAELSREDRGNILLEAGSLLMKAGRFEEALGRLFRAEHLVLEGQVPSLRRKVQECLQRLGKHAEQGYELADGLSLKRGKAGAKPAGDRDAGEVVAYLGPETISASELDDLIAREIDERAAAIPGLPPERVAELKAQAQKSFSAPEARLQKLREVLAREVLYREGQERKADEAPRVQRRIADFRRDAVVEEVVLSEMRERIRISEGDLRNYHRANAARYLKRASARVRLGLVEDEARARQLLAAAKGEEDFARAVRERSLEPATRERGGLLEEPVVQGEPFPVLGAAPELSKAIFETTPPAPVAAPVKHGDRYAVAYVLERSPERPLPFEEVRERVGRDYAREKEVEVQSELVRQLFEKHRVAIVTEAILPGAGEAKPAAAPSAAPPAPAPAGKSP